MITLLTSLALVAGVAQAQDGRNWDQEHALTCSDTQIDMVVQVTPVNDHRPASILYQDGSVEETNCLGTIAPARVTVLRQELRDQCVFDGLDEALCSDLSNDIVDQMVEMLTVPPIDRIAVEIRGGGDATREDILLGVHFDDGSSEVWRGRLRVEDGQFRTVHRRSASSDPGTRLECTQRGDRWAHGVSTAEIGRIERKDEVRWRCTDPAQQLDIQVAFLFKNRAVSGPEAQ